MAENVLDAVAMAHAVSADPQFHFPLRPQLVPGLVWVPTPSGLIVDGGPSRQAFAGRAADLLPELMATLDGTREVAQLAEDTGLEPDRLQAVLSLLYATGLLQEGLDATPTASADPALTFLSRSIDTTRVNRNGDQAVGRLATATVTVLAETADLDLARGIASLLVREGVGSVRIRSEFGPDAADSRLALVVGDAPGLLAAALSARAEGVQVLPVLARAGVLHLGPLLGPTHAACAGCAFRQREALLADEEASCQAPPRWARTAGLLVVRDVVAMISRVGTAATERYLVSTQIGELDQRSRLVTPSPSCPVCMDPSPGEDAEAGIPLAWVYAHSVAFPPRESLNPKDHQVHYKSSNIALQQRHRVWLASERILLPKVGDSAGGVGGIDSSHSEPASPSAPGAVTVEALADVLVRTVGLRHGPSESANRVDRWCATGGNLGSPTAYLIAREVAGLAPGVYGFQRGDASLARLRWADPHAAVPGVAPDVPAVLVLTGALDVVAGKYGPFGWRIIALDAGVATTQAALIAAEHGVDLRPLPAWDDHALADLLGADPDAEPVTAVLLVTAHSFPSVPSGEPA